MALQSRFLAGKTKASESLWRMRLHVHDHEEVACPSPTTDCPRCLAGQAVHEKGRSSDGRKPSALRPTNSFAALFEQALRTSNFAALLTRISHES
jgi:hypothetical protein